MKALIKQARKKKGWTMKTLAQELKIDPALVSKFESGQRMPTKEQAIKIASILEIDQKTIMTNWLKEKIMTDYGYEPYLLDALMVAEEQARYNVLSQPSVSQNLQAVLDEIDKLKAKLDKLRQYDSYRIAQALEVEYTYESNRIEGNTLTLRETDLVINEGITISGKTMREHLEAINHKDAIAYIKHLMEKKSNINEREVLAMHNLILRGIHPDDAGKYRNVQVMITGSAHQPPQPYMVAKEMEEYFIWYEQNKNLLHPVILAAEMHERLVTIHPFIDGNGRTSRLVMNLILLQHGYVIANIKGDNQNRMQYYQSLETAQVKQDKEAFLIFISNIEKQSLERYLSVIGG